MAYNYVSSFVYGGSRSEISYTFTKHTTSLYDLQRTANNAIDDWKNGLIKQIEDHAFEQKRLIEQARQKQEECLRDMRQQFVEINNIYEDKRNDEEIKRLLDKCRTLKVELVGLNFDPREKDFIRVTPIELSERMDQQEFSSNKTENDKFEKRSTEGAGAGSFFDKSSTSNSYSTATSATSDRINQSSTNQFTHKEDPPISANNYNSKYDAVGDRDGNSNEKCPICLMIFPSHMSERSRTIHVEEH